MMALSTGMSLDLFEWAFRHPIGTLQWHRQQPGYWWKQGVLAASWVLTWGVLGSWLLVTSVATGRSLAWQLHLPTHNDLLLGCVGGVMVATSAYVSVDILCTSLINTGLPPGIRRRARSKELLCCGVLWFVGVGGTLGYACTILLRPWWKPPDVPLWADLYQVGPRPGDQPDAAASPCCLQGHPCLCVCVLSVVCVATACSLHSC
jgi:hypothetical protein